MIYGEGKEQMRVLIVAKCNVNMLVTKNMRMEIIVLIVAKCNVNSILIGDRTNSKLY